MILRAKTTALLFPIGLCYGCAGPSTPLGAIWAIHPSQVSQTMPIVADAPSETRGVSGVTIDFKPNRQVLHGPKPLLVHVHDPGGISEKPKIKVRYDGFDVTKAFMSQSNLIFASGGHDLYVRVPVVRLSPHMEHRIEVRYFNSAGHPSWTAYQPPVCRAFDLKLVRHTDSFTPEISLLTMIESLSQQAGINPALTTALIAQESSFNPRTVSWAKAVGLTQITPIAEDEVSDQVPDFQKWPHYEGIGRMPASIIKSLVLVGRINEKNDWKLDRELSIRGGLAYLRFLEKLWSTPEMRSRFDEVERTKLVLASYNSGRLRVLQALHQYGKNWLKAPELREARRYVNRVFSFCDFFSQDQNDENNGQMTQLEVDDENQT